MNCRTSILSGSVVRIATLMIAAVALSGGSAMAATIGITLVPDAPEYNVGDTVTVDVLATTEETLVGYGFDFLLSDDIVLEYDEFGAGAPFTDVPSLDGDGVAGLSFVGGASGEGLLIGVATFAATGSGEVVVNIGVTEGDLSEGFGTNGEGAFLDYDFDPTTITVLSASGPGGGPVIPEPATIAMLAGGLLLLRRRS
jgi:hypothetical protein